MNNIFNNYDSENDERLDKKFSYNYQVIKNVYPKVSELPEDEVREIIRKYYDATGTHEDSIQAVMNYIREKEPEWKRLYFKDEEQSQQDLSDPFGELKEALINFEDTPDYPYMDKIGNITTCVGNLDEDFEEFASHPWCIRGTGRLATRQEKWIAYQKLLAAKKPNYRAYYYKDKTNLSIPMDYCKQLLDEGIKSRDSELRKGIPNYDKMSQNMKNALLETHYTSNILPWRHLKDGARGLDQEYLCGELERDTTGRPDLIERNAWAKEQCLKGYFIK